MANIAIIVAAATVAGTWGHHYLFGATDTTGPPRYWLGENLGPVNELDFSQAPLTLLLYVNSECPACTTSMPFYAEILRQHEKSGSIVRVVLASRDSLPILREYLGKHGVRPEYTVSIAPSSHFKNIATPHVLLVEEDGDVVGSWLGRLPAEYEEVILELALTEMWPEAAPGSVEEMLY